MGLVDLFRESGFQEGLTLGIITSLGVVLIAVVRRFRIPVPLAGIAASGATLIGLDRTIGVPGDLVVGVVALAAGGSLARLFGSNLLVRSLAAAPGAVLIADAIELDEIGWLRPFAVLTTIAGAALAADFDQRRVRSGLGPALMAVTALGVYVTVPDTERALVLVGAFLPIALLGWPRVLGSLGVAGSYAAVGIVVWTAAVDGRARPGSIVGATACVGVLALEPLCARIAPRRVIGADRFPSRSWFVLAGTHLALVTVCARLAGSEESPARAALIVAAAFGASALALTLGARVGQRPAS